MSMYQQAIEAGGLAVVTGGASGVGYAAAKRFAEAGLDIVIADLPGEALDKAVAELQTASPDGVKITGIPADVSSDESVQALADKVFGLGPVAVLMNNAGIGLPTKSWEGMENWRSVLEVNFFGVLRGVHAFVPRMIEAARPAAVINTGSKQGITTPPGNPGYNVSKAGVKVLTEQLAHELLQAGAPVSAHLFVPGFTYTGMISRHMPQKPDSAWTSEETVDYLLGRLARGDFYILCPDNDVGEARDRRRIEWALQDITQNRPALSRWHPDYAEAFGRFEKS